MPKFSRKDKVELVQIDNAEKTTTITISIEGNHHNPLLDTLVQNFNNNIKNILLTYKEKEVVKKQPKKKKGSVFGSAGGFV